MYRVVVYVTSRHTLTTHCTVLHLLIFCKFRNKFPVHLSQSENTEDAGCKGRRGHLLHESGVGRLQTIVPDPGVSPHSEEGGYGLGGDALLLLEAGVGGPQLAPEGLVRQGQMVLTLLTQKCLEDLDK